MDLGIEGRAALVCGGSKGIGHAIAAALAAEGAKVAITSREGVRAREAAAELGVSGLEWDSEQPGATAALVDAARDALGAPVEILVCNTGGPPAGPDALGFPREEWERAHRSLVLAPLDLIGECLPAMRERRWGRVLNVVGTTVREPLPYLALSTAHRTGIVATFKTLAHANASSGVTFNSLLPGQIATERIFSMTGGRENAEAGAAATIPAGRLGEPAEMGAAAAFLCSDLAGYITGETLTVDGGLTRSI